MVLTIMKKNLNHIILVRNIPTIIILTGSVRTIIRSGKRFQMESLNVNTM